MHAELYDINIRTSSAQLKQIRGLAAKLKRALLEADGLGDVPVSSFLILGEVVPRPSSLQSEHLTSRSSHSWQSRTPKGPL